jgi:hypothetical protein
MDYYSCNGLAWNILLRRQCIMVIDFQKGKGLSDNWKNQVSSLKIKSNWTDEMINNIKKIEN